MAPIIMRFSRFGHIGASTSAPPREWVGWTGQACYQM
jgi:hypothetical protein